MMSIKECKICGKTFVSSERRYLCWRCMRINDNKEINGLCNVIEKNLKVYEADDENNMTRIIHYGYNDKGLPEIKSYGEWFTDR